MRSDLVKPVFFTGGLLIGAGVAYILTKKHYEQKADDDIQSVKEMYQQQAVKLKEELSIDHVNPMDEYEETLSRLQYLPEDSDAPPITDYKEAFKKKDWSRPGYEPEDDTLSDLNAKLIARDILEDPTDPTTWDRSDEDPYVISHEEFAEDNDYEKISFTYFEGDDVVIDEAEDICTDVNGVLRDHNLKHFGMGSQDENIVYIRNEDLETDFEVMLDRRSYVNTILGLGEHDDTDMSEPKVKKMRHNE